jgi:Xaa-Pro aminopeptidase
MSIYHQRLQQFRTFLRERLAAQGFIIPRADVYQNEYVVPADERLNWLTGFTGSAGYAVILPEAAALFIDGRYTLQAKQEVDSALYQVFQIPEFDLKIFFERSFQSGDKICFDPWLMTKNDVERWTKVLENFNAEFVPASENPIDVLWHDRPHRPLDAIFSYSEIYAGLSVHNKLDLIIEKLQQFGADVFVCNAPESICWLFNIRGKDFPFSPLIDCFALIYRSSKSEIFIDTRKLTPEIKAALEPYVTFREYGSFSEHLQNIKDIKVLLDPTRAPFWAMMHLDKTSVIWAPDPCLSIKAIKNSTEISGMRLAHVKDGVAVTKFLAWLEQALANNEVLDELSLVARLETFREEQDQYQGPSFSTIAGVAENGAIVHYRPTPESNKKIQGDCLILLDSGGQYLDGTTDITRVIPVGIPTEEQRDRFTRVLKGHIAIATTPFPKGTTGSQLDVLARRPLWQAGLDYDHGTGHGVGCFLSVHEGPQRIGKSPSTVALIPGMILSNEPGYYLEGQYGIRIENLVLVQPTNEPTYQERPMFCFETLTMAPINTRLIVTEMLTAPERQWLNDYHAQVRETLLPHLDTETAAWLIEATEEI